MWMCVGMWSFFTPFWVSGARAKGSSVQALTSCTFEDWTGRVGASEAPLFLLSLGISWSVTWAGWGLCAGAFCGKLLEPRLLEKRKMLSFLIWGLAFQSKTWPLCSWPVSAQILTESGAYWKNPGQPWGHPPPSCVLSLWSSVTMCPNVKGRCSHLWQPPCPPRPEIIQLLFFLVAVGCLMARGRISREPLGCSGSELSRVSEFT